MRRKSRFVGWLTLLVSLLWMNGCAELGRRPPDPHDVMLTKDNIGMVAGVYQVPLCGSAIDRFNELQLLVEVSFPTECRVEDQVAGRLVVAIEGDGIRLTLHAREQICTATYAYHVVDGEIQIGPLSDWSWWWLIWGHDHLTAGIVKKTDGSIIIRHSRRVMAYIVVLPWNFGYPPLVWQKLAPVARDK